MKSRRSASRRQSVPNRTTACRPSVSMSSRSVVTSAISSPILQRHRAVLDAGRDRPRCPPRRPAASPRRAAARSQSRSRRLARATRAACRARCRRRPACARLRRRAAQNTCCVSGRAQPRGILQALRCGLGDSRGDLVLQRQVVEAPRQIGGDAPDDEPLMVDLPGRVLLALAPDAERADSSRRASGSASGTSNTALTSPGLATNGRVRPHLGDHRGDQIVGAGEIGRHVAEDPRIGRIERHLFAAPRAAPQPPGRRPSGSILPPGKRDLPRMRAQVRRALGVEHR